MKFSLELAVNASSLGQVSCGILAELFKRNILVALFPIGPIDLSHFNAPPQFEQWLRVCLEGAHRKFSREQPSLKYFHISNATSAIGDYSRLYTVHESSKITETEVNILKRHNSVMVPSNYNKQVFGKYGIKAEVAPNFYDERHIYKIDRPARDYVTWGLIGKLENRKHTGKIIDVWVQKFGGNPDFRLNLNIWNSFLFHDVPVEQRFASHKRVLENALKRELPWNVNLMPWLSHEDINKCYNEQDINISLSGAEGFDLPALNSLCLSKKCLILNAHAHKDYATTANSILVEPNGTAEIYDSFFFRKGQPYNQGNLYTWDKEEVMAAMDTALAAPEPDPSEAERLKKEYSVSAAVDKLIEGF